MAKEQFNLRLEGELIQSIHEAARQQGISATQFVTDILNMTLGRINDSQQLGLSTEQVQQLILQEISRLSHTFASKLHEIELKSKEEIAQLKAKNVLLDSALKAVKADGQYYINKLEEDLLAKIADFEELLDQQATLKANVGSNSNKEDKQPKQKSLRLSQLADRLGVDEKLIVKNKFESFFADWSKQLDPDGIGWRLERGKFLPDQPLPVKEESLEVDKSIEVLSGDSLVVA